MRAERNDVRGLPEGASRRGTSPRGSRRANPYELEAATTGACPGAHARAVMTVRLTLLLIIFGVAFFLFTGPGGGVPAGPELGGAAERLK